MSTRLVVGCGSVGGTLVAELADWPGDLRVVEPSERRVQRLRESGVPAVQGDPTDPETVREQAEDVLSVVVAGDSVAENREAARVAREVHPDAVLLVYAGRDATAEDRAALEPVADEVVDPVGATTDYLTERVGDDGLQLRKLRRALWDAGEPLAVVTHDNPDPDAIASALALERIAETLGIEAEVCYFGDITHQENRAFVNLLDIDLTRLDPDADLSGYGGIALVDHSRPGVNDQLPEETAVDIVIDHHPPRAPVDAGFVDLRSEVGSTSTLMVQYLDAFGMEFDEQVATALLFGIRVDTDDFTREVSVQDFEAAATVVPVADFGTLERIESPSVSTDTFETIANAIANRTRRGAVLSSYVGDLSDRDALAQAADRLLDLEGVSVTMVYGIRDGVIYVSGRARGTGLDLGEALRDAFGQIGSAGGHADMAGAQIHVADTTLDPETDGTPDAEAGDTAGEQPAAGTPAEDPDAADGSADDDAVAEDELAAEDDAVADHEGAIPVDSAAADDLETVIAERFYEAIRARPRREAPDLTARVPESGTDGDR